MPAQLNWTIDLDKPEARNEFAVVGFYRLNGGGYSIQITRELKDHPELDRTELARDALAALEAESAKRRK